MKNEALSYWCTPTYEAVDAWVIANYILGGATAELTAETVTLNRALTEP